MRAYWTVFLILLVLQLTGVFMVGWTVLVGMAVFWPLFWTLVFGIILKQSFSR